MLIGWLLVVLVAVGYDAAVGHYVAAGVLLLLGIGTAALHRRGRSVADARDARPGVSPGWYAEPSNPESLRYWDGTRWTEHHWGADATPVWLVWTMRAVLLLFFLATWTIGERVAYVLLLAFAVLFTGERLLRRRRSRAAPTATSRGSS